MRSASRAVEMVHHARREEQRDDEVARALGAIASATAPRRAAFVSDMVPYQFV